MERQMLLESNLNQSLSFDLHGKSSLCSSSYFSFSSRSSRCCSWNLPKCLMGFEGFSIQYILAMLSSSKADQNCNFPCIDMLNSAHYDSRSTKNV
jgi:hypothetical protein